LGRTEFRPNDYIRTFVGYEEFVQPKRNETAPRSECRFTFKNALTQLRLLEMAEYREGRRDRNTVVFPASDDASFVTASKFFVDGGFAQV
jgi:hypothetical protein